MGESLLERQLAWGRLREPQRPPGGIRGVLTLEKVTFRYPGAERAVLEDVSFTASPGTTTAITSFGIRCSRSIG